MVSMQCSVVRYSQPGASHGSQAVKKWTHWQSLLEAPLTEVEDETD